MGEKKKGQYIPAIRQIEPADEQVADILEDRQQHFDELRLSPPERERLLELRQKKDAQKKQEKAKAEKREANRITTYLPIGLISAIVTIAKREGVTMAQVITFFLLEAVERYDRQEINFWGHKYPSDSPRYEWNLIHPKDQERMGKVHSGKSEKNGWGA